MKCRTVHTYTGSVSVYSEILRHSRQFSSLRFYRYSAGCNVMYHTSAFVLRRRCMSTSYHGARSTCFTLFCSPASVLYHRHIRTFPYPSCYIYNLFLALSHTQTYTSCFIHHSSLITHKKTKIIKLPFNEFLSNFSVVQAFNRNGWQSIIAGVQRLRIEPIVDEYLVWCYSKKMECIESQHCHGQR